MFAYIKVFKLFRFTNLGDIFYTLLCSSFSNISRILSHVNMNRFPLLHCSIVFHCHNLVNHSPIDRNFIHFIFFYMNYATTNVLAQCKFCLQHKFLEMEILGQNVYIFKCWQILLNFLLKRLYQLKLLLPMYKRTCFLEPLLILGISILYYFLSVWKMAFWCCFNIYFIHSWWGWTSFHMFDGHLCSLFWRTYFHQEFAEGKQARFHDRALVMRKVFQPILTQKNQKTSISFY